MSGLDLGSAASLGILGRAKNVMQGWVAAPPAAAVPFNVACGNGHRLRGHRTEGYQALRCPTCGEAVFVLPLSPLPEPAASAAGKKSKSARSVVDPYPSDDAPHALVDPPAWSPEPSGSPSARGSASAANPPDDDVAEIDWVDEVVDPSPAAAATAAAAAVSARPQPARPQSSGKPPAQARPPRPMAAPVAPPAPPTPAPVPRRTAREWALAHRNPLLVAACLLVIVGAVGIRRWRQRLEELPRIAELGRTEGFRKLDSGEFFAAKKLLSEAAAAVDAMRGRFEGAESIRQAAREAAIFADLAPVSLEELVEEAATFDVATWSSHFAGKYQGRSILLETTITAVPDLDKPSTRFEDAYRIVSGRGPTPHAQGRIGFEGFELFAAAPPKVGDTKILGARLASLELSTNDNTWVLTLEPDSGVYITHTSALESMHWPIAEPVEEAAP